MSNDLTTSQKIRADLTARLRQAEAEIETAPSLDNARLIRWLKSKLEFYNGAHREYDRVNSAAAQWQAPSMKEQLDDAGFGSFGPM